MYITKDIFFYRTIKLKTPGLHVLETLRNYLYFKSINKQSVSGMFLPLNKKINLFLGFASRASSKKFQEAQQILISMKGKIAETMSFGSIDTQHTETSRRTR